MPGRAEFAAGRALQRGGSGPPCPLVVPERFCRRVTVMAQVWALQVGSSLPLLPKGCAGSCLGSRGAGRVPPWERTPKWSPRPALQLLARIERMERRVQLVKKDSEREKHRIFQGFEVDEKPEAEACEKLPLECPQDLLEPPPTLQPKHFPYGRNGKGHKR